MAQDSTALEYSIDVDFLYEEYLRNAQKIDAQELMNKKYMQMTDPGIIISISSCA